MFRVHTLRWAAGAFCAIVGALTFVTPHQFVGVSYAVLQPVLNLWGLLLLFGGAGLLLAGALALPGRLVALAHALAALPLFMLAFSAGSAGGWTGVTVYSILGAGTLVAPRLAAAAGPGSPRRPDLFAIVIAVSACVNGTIMLAAPGQYGSTIFDGVRPYLVAYGLGFLGGGLGVLAAECRPASARWVRWLPYLVLGASLFAFGPPTSLPARAFTSFAYYNGFGTIIALLPRLGRQLDRIDPASLRTRLALALAAASALTLVIGVSIDTDREERSVRTGVSDQQVLLVGVVGQQVSDYVDLHRSAVAALAIQLGAAPPQPAVQQALLSAVEPAFGDLFALELRDSSGAVVATSGDATRADLAGAAVNTWLSGRTERGVDAFPSPVASRAVLVIAEPVRDRTGNVTGVVVGGLDGKRLDDAIRLAAAGARSTVSLVDSRGRVIVSSDDRVAALTDVRAAPPVSALAGAASGNLTFRAGASERLAAYARVPDLGWGVTVERPVADALAGVRFGRDVAFVMLFAIIVASLGLGALAAGWLIEPLAALAAAASRFASGDREAPIPRSGVTEVGRLASVFGTMRQSLAEREADRDRLLSQITAERDRLQQEIDTLPEGIWIADGEGRVVLVNSAALDILGPPADAPESAVGSAYRSFQADGHPHAPDDLPVVRTARLGESVRGEQILVRNEQSGRDVPLLVNGAPLRGPDGRSTGGIVVFQDITAIKEVERAREEFLASVSHDLKNPLTTVSGVAQLLQRIARRAGTPESAQIAERLGEIIAASRRMANQLDGLLDGARLQLGHAIELQREPRDLVAFAREVVQEHQHRTDRHRLRVEAAEPVVHADIDAGRFWRVLDNLLSNAVKYSPDGGDIVVRVDRDGDEVRVSVRDHGLGIPETDLDRVFDRFFRGGNVVGRINGTGIGLAGARRLAELHGGTIDVASREGDGACFTVRLPIGPETAAPA